MLRSWVLLAGIGGALLMTVPVEAQLFGERQVGRPSQQGTRPGRIELDPSMEFRSILEQGRFLRDATPDGFVGGTNTRRGFVGVQQQATQQPPRSPTQPLPQLDRRRATAINRPLPPLARNEMYHPRVVLEVQPSAEQSQRLSLARPRRDEAGGAAQPVATFAAGTAEHLQRMLERHIEGRIEVSQAGRRATLLGEVASEHDRRLAELLLSFEPGVDQVENELRVRQP